MKRKLNITDLLSWPLRLIVSLIALIPLRVLYLLSDFVYFLLYRIIRYRRNVILNNLRNSFPEKGDEELEIIAKSFYRHISRLFVEVPKLIRIRPEALSRRISFAPGAGELLDNYFQQNKSVLLVLGHFGNWEWAAVGYMLQRSHTLVAPYHPLSNKVFDGLFYDFRIRFGTKVVPMQHFGKFMMQMANQPHAYFMVSDQSPSPEHAYWVPFLNQDTPVFRGPEKLAAKLNMPVVFASVRPVSKGHYEFNVFPLTDNPKELPEGELTRMHTRLLEQEIQLNPGAWLWSHRRWKHKRK